MTMHENNTEPQRVILAAADLGTYDVDVSLDELEELACTAGAQVLCRICQKRESLDRATVLGTGRMEELRQAAYNQEAELVLFDHELTAVQQRNAENILGVPVVDRTMLILDIFAQRAVTDEGKLQVELAQQRYLLPRLAGMGQSLSRLGGGIGTRGPGETKLESDRRHIRRRIQTLEEKLSDLSARRDQMRARRRKDALVTVAIVGYTNAGKSTLLNALTGASVLAEDKLFATLDPTSRGMELPDGRTVLLIDTVGFIRRLPHHLVEAFQSTLEEAVNADLLLNVCDISSPEVRAHVEVTEQLLADLGAGSIPLLTVYNKCDAVPGLPFPLSSNTVLVSARTGYGLDNLSQAISRTLPPSQKRLQVLLPFSQAGLMHEILREGKIFTQEYTENGILLDALVDHKILYKLTDMVLPEQP